MLNEEGEDNFTEKFISALNNGYTLGASNAYFSPAGKQYFYAVFYYKVPKSKTIERSGNIPELIRRSPIG